MKYLLSIILFLTMMLFANAEEGCSISALLEQTKSPLFKNTQDKNCTEDIEVKIEKTMRETAINKNLISVKVLHENKEVLIVRTNINDEFTCPPFCIEPMKIEDVITVGELEVLSFIDKLKEKKARLLIDVRESSIYKKGTIPGAINLPFTMLEDKSKYQKEVLKLLGGKHLNSKWSFKDAQSLLIFGNSPIRNSASSSIKKLLELGYPSSKLLYYRAGVSSWKGLGLTVK